jgi:adenosine deaminase
VQAAGDAREAQKPPVPPAASCWMDTTEIESFIKGLPKAELHLHIEGSLEPELPFDLAARNSIDLPFADVEACRAAYSFTDLKSFLDIYCQGASVLLTELDFFDLMKAYLHRVHADGVRRTEIFFDLQTHSERGIGFDVFMAGFGRTIEEAEAELGISAGLIMCFLRHLPGSEAVATFAAAHDHLHQLIGVGLDSSEVDHPPGEFAEAFAIARDAGLHLVPHAGEEGPPEYIVEALDVERTDHGVRCEDDPKLV